MLKKRISDLRAMFSFVASLSAASLLIGSSVPAAEPGEQPSPRSGETAPAKDASKGLRQMIKGDDSVMIDQDARRIALTGEFTLQQGQLEYLLISRGGKDHEAVVTLDAKPSSIAFAMLLCKYKWVGNVTETGDLKVPKGDGVEFWFEYKDEKGETVKVRAEEMVYNVKTKKTMRQAPWIFTGSKYERDEQSGRNVFMADVEKNVAAIYRDPYALFNTPMDTGSDDTFYEINRAKIPKRGTKVRVWIEPAAEKEMNPEDLIDSTPEARPRENEKYRKKLSVPPEQSRGGAEATGTPPKAGGAAGEGKE